MKLAKIVTSKAEALNYRLASPSAPRTKAWEVHSPEGVWVGIFVFEGMVSRAALLAELERLYSRTGWEIEPVIPA